MTPAPSGLTFDDLWPVGEWWIPGPLDYGGWLDGDDRPEDRLYEYDTHELGVRAADAVVNENGGPEYRRWEREDCIRHRFRRA